MRAFLLALVVLGCKGRAEKQPDKPLVQAPPADAAQAMPAIDAPPPPLSPNAASLANMLETAAPDADALGENKPAVRPDAIALGSGSGSGSATSDAEDRGDFKLVVDDSGEAAKSVMRPQVTMFLKGALIVLNKMLKLPRDIPVVLKPCGVLNMYYEPDDPKIVVCDEFAASMHETFSLYKSADAARTATIHAVMFGFLHELGHCLVHQFKIPAVGRAEDAADQMATLQLIGAGQDVSFALTGAEFWLALQVMRDDDKRFVFWDEHGLDEQRFYNILCLIYGSNPDKFESLVRDGDLPRTRARRCVREFTDVKAAWSTLLAPHVK